MDAIQAAGGVRGGSRYGSVNLAAVVLDGQQLLVGRRAAVPAGTSPGTASGGAAPPATATGEQLININAATAAELEQLDGIGPVLAQTIVTWRTEQGPFATIEDLLDVSGIGDATLAGMRDQVTVG